MIRSVPVPGAATWSTRAARTLLSSRGPYQAGPCKSGGRGRRTHVRSQGRAAAAGMAFALPMLESLHPLRAFGGRAFRCQGKTPRLHRGLSGVSLEGDLSRAHRARLRDLADSGAVAASPGGFQHPFGPRSPAKSDRLNVPIEPVTFYEPVTLSISRKGRSKGTAQYRYLDAPRKG